VERDRNNGNTFCSCSYVVVVVYGHTDCCIFVVIFLPSLVFSAKIDLHSVQLLLYLLVLHIPIRKITGLVLNLK
jgi:predicted nucleic acid-binding Zn finger protein